VTKRAPPPKLPVTELPVTELPVTELPVTESENPLSKDIDTRSTQEILEIFFTEDAKIVEAIRKESLALHAFIEATICCFQQGGRLFYVGAGTSGRLGNLDAVECPPTFGTDPGQVQSIIAGGELALSRAVEGAEDHEEAGATQAHRVLTAQDITLGIAASGTTPFVLGFLKAAFDLGVPTGFLSFNKKKKVLPYVVYPIYPEVGPEIISGSTRLKAGTGTKLILNMISSISMIRLGKVYSHYMVDLSPSCHKLYRRAERILKALTGLSEEEAHLLLEKTQGNIKEALLIHHKQLSQPEAVLLLKRYGNNVRKALEAF
jgi:N-acetylmuramic acid 6-phosphate etherase